MHPIFWNGMLLIYPVHSIFQSQYVRKGFQYWILLQVCEGANAHESIVVPAELYCSLKGNSSFNSQSCADDPQCTYDAATNVCTPSLEPLITAFWDSILVHQISIRKDGLFIGDSSFHEARNRSNVLEHVLQLFANNKLLRLSKKRFLFMKKARLTPSNCR